MDQSWSRCNAAVRWSALRFICLGLDPFGANGQFAPPSQTFPHQASNPMDLHLRGKRVLITGASKGIGAAAAEAFAEEGCHLMLAARSGDQLKALTERLRSTHQIDP